MVKANSNHEPKGAKDDAGHKIGGKFMAKDGIWKHDLERLVAVVRIPTPGMGSAADKHSTARAWAKANLTDPKGWENEYTGWRLIVQTAGIDEAIHRLRWPHGISRQTMAAIPELVRVAIPIQTEPDTEGRPDILAVHTFIVPMEVSGEIYRVRMVVRETGNAGNTYYGHHLEGIDIEKSGAGGVRREENSLGHTQTPDEVSVGRLLHGFKPHTEEMP